MTDRTISWGAITPRQAEAIAQEDELSQRRLLRFVERITGKKLPTSQFGVVVIDTAGQHGGCQREQ